MIHKVKSFIKKYVFWIAVILFVFLVSREFVGIKELVSTVKTSNPLFIVSAIAAGLLYIASYVYVYKKVYDLAGVKTTYLKVFYVVQSAYFVGIATTAGAVSAVPYTVSQLSSKENKSVKILAGILITTLSVNLSFIFVLMMGLFFLSTKDELSRNAIVATLMFILLNAVITMIIIICLWRPQLIKSLFSAIQRPVDFIGKKLLKRSIIPDEFVDNNLHEFNSASKMIAKQPGKLAYIIFLSFVSHLLMASVLYLCMLSFGAHPDMGTVIASYSVFYLFSVISVTPQGVGIVEAIAPVIMISFGLNSGQAAAVTIAYRGLTYWLSVALGFVSIRLSKSSRFGGTISTDYLK